MSRKIYYDEDALCDVDLEQTECCGIEELHNLNKDPNVCLVRVAEESQRRAMIIFHDAIRYKKGSRLARKIRAKKLGILQSSKKVMNPNSNNVIQMWIWYPDWVALDKYCDTLTARSDYNY